jgi:hypothetical protein
MLCPVCAECPFTNGHSLPVPAVCVCVWLHTEVSAPVCVDVNVAVSAECPFAHAHHGALQSCPVCAPTRLSVNDRALDGPTAVKSVVLV